MSKTLTVCCQRGCPNLTRDSYCDQHTRPDDSRPDSTARGYDHRWARKSRSFLAAHRWCKCGARAQHVHHLDGHGPHGPRGFDDSNLLSLCHSCHSSVTAQQPRNGR